MSTGLSRLQNLTLTGTAITNGILLSILKSYKNELIEQNLAGTRISLCKWFPFIVELKKLKYFSASPRDITALGRTAVVEIAERCPFLHWTARKPISWTGKTFHRLSD